MKPFNIKEILAIGLVLVVLFAVYTVTKDKGGDDLELSGSNASQKCEVNIVTAVTIGDDVSTTILSAASNRAWATIGVSGGETEPLFISFDEGAAATTDNGVILTATSTTMIEFGLNTRFPYTGAVTGITGTASTSVMVTECKYTS